MQEQRRHPISWRHELVTRIYRFDFHGVAYLERTSFGFNIGICDLAVVNNQGIPAGATRSSVCPANTLRELGVRVRQEELHAISTRAVSRERKYHTIESSVILLAFPQALMTKASLKATTATMSTPFALSSARFLMYPGRWLTEQVGVKAPFLTEYGSDMETFVTIYN